MHACWIPAPQPRDLTHAQEHEGIDRADTLLPGLQESFALQVFAAAATHSTPVVLVLVNGGVVSIDALVAPAAAIVEAFNPVDHGTRAIAESLFGGANRWGKLPVTLYGKDYTKDLDAAGAGISNYGAIHPPVARSPPCVTSSITPGPLWHNCLPDTLPPPPPAASFAKGPGRGYRYYTGTPLFPFGWGLSLTQFSHACLKAEPGPPATADASDASDASTDDVPFRFSCTVTNEGPLAGDEVLLVYHRVSAAIRARIGAAHPVPFKDLVGFQRVGQLAPGESQAVSFTLDRDRAASLTTADGSRKTYPGEHEFLFSRGDAASDVTIAVALQ